MAKTIEDYTRVYNTFDNMQGEAQKKAFEICNTIGDYAKFKNVFAHYENDARTNAKQLINNLYHLKYYLKAFDTIHLFEISDVTLLGKAESFDHSDQVEITNELKIEGYTELSDNEITIYLFNYSNLDKVLAFTFKDDTEISDVAVDFFNKINLNIEDESGNKIAFKLKINEEGGYDAVFAHSGAIKIMTSKKVDEDIFVKTK